MFRRFKPHVEKKSKCSLKKLRKNDGDEHISKEFAQLCEDEGIKHGVLAPNTP